MVRALHSVFINVIYRELLFADFGLSAPKTFPNDQSLDALRAAMENQEVLFRTEIGELAFEQRALSLMTYNLLYGSSLTVNLENRGTQCYQGVE
jgi:hypothetical protein